MKLVFSLVVPSFYFKRHFFRPSIYISGQCPGWLPVFIQFNSCLIRLIRIPPYDAASASQSFIHPAHNLSAAVVHHVILRTSIRKRQPFFRICMERHGIPKRVFARLLGTDADVCPRTLHICALVIPFLYDRHGPRSLGIRELIHPCPFTLRCGSI